MEFSPFSRRPDAKWIDPGQADEVSEMIVLINAPWLSEMDSRHTIRLPESLSVWVNVFAAWVAKSSSRKAGSVMPLFDEVRFERHPGVKEECAKVKHDKTKRCLRRVIAESEHGSCTKPCLATTGSTSQESHSWFHR